MAIGLCTEVVALLLHKFWKFKISIMRNGRDEFLEHEKAYPHCRVILIVDIWFWFFNIFEKRDKKDNITRACYHSWPLACITFLVLKFILYFKLLPHQLPTFCLLYYQRNLKLRECYTTQRKISSHKKERGKK